MKVQRFWVAVLSAGLLLTLAAPAPADESPPKPPAGALGMIRDLRLTVLARRELQSDRVLAPLNLGIRVRDGVAEVWGNIPSDEVARQAVAKVGTVKGIRDVRPSFFLQATADRTTVEVAKPDGETGRLKRMLPAPVLSVAGEGQKLRPGDANAALAALPQPERRPAVLLPPRPLGGKETPPRTEERVETPRLRGSSLPAAVDRIRTAEARFRAVPVRVEGNILILRRGLTADDDVTDLAQALRGLPGVAEVRLVDE
jgi:hypothetical protein